MAEQTKIQWADDTINFWSGCSKISPGCQFCYAESLSNRKLGNIGGWGKGAPRKLHESAFALAKRLNAKPWVCDACGNAEPDGSDDCRKCGSKTGAFALNRHRRRIFSLSLGDWLDDEVPIEWLARMMETVLKCNQVTWILCSKRWELFRERLKAAIGVMHCDPLDIADLLAAWLDGARIPRNIIGLCSVENQPMADKRILDFLNVPLACHGLSMEPLLGPVDLTAFEPFCSRGGSDMDGIDWIIVGGESGANARPCNVDWIRAIVQQAQASGMATFVKQLGAKPEGKVIGSGLNDFGWLNRIRHPKGGDPAEWPADLRVQEWPKGF